MQKFSQEREKAKGFVSNEQKGEKAFNPKNSEQKVVQTASLVKSSKEVQTGPNPKQHHKLKKSGKEHVRKNFVRKMLPQFSKQTGCN